MEKELFEVMTPQEIVAELDKHIVGQTAAKRSVAIALRNRSRRMNVKAELRQEITPKNILMIGPTGVGFRFMNSFVHIGCNPCFQFRLFGTPAIRIGASDKAGIHHFDRESGFIDGCFA